MNAIIPLRPILKRFCVAIAHAGGSLLGTATIRADAEALLFSAKSFAAAMLAYYLSLRIGLPKPYWAIVTVYIVSQTSAGASLSRGIYRFAGTIVGATATVVIVPNFANDPLACSVVLSGWIGLCLYLSLLDRTPRAYAFVLAGYTVSLIGFPSVLDPGGVFETASMRVQEISIGILCAVLVHRFVLPRRVTGQFVEKLSATLREARRLTGDAFRGEAEPALHGDRQRLAAALFALQGLATHLPYDPSPVPQCRKALRPIHDRLAQLLLLTMEIEDGIRTFGNGDAPGELVALLNAAGAWVVADVANRNRAAIGIVRRARTFQTRIGAEGATLPDRRAANLAGHVAETVAVLHDCDRLERNLAQAVRPHGGVPRRGKRRTRGYVYFHDHATAARCGLGATVGILIGCAFWIWSAWPEGGMAVSVLGVCCTLYGNVDTPAPIVIKYMIGLLYGVAISLAYSFFILPRVTDFDVLVAVLAPAFLFAGSLQARPPTMLMAFGITLTIPILTGLGVSYAGDFAAFLNSTIAVLASIGFGIVSMTLFQTIPANAAIKRLLRRSRKDVGRRALGRGVSDEAHWRSLMVDRTALLLPKFLLSGGLPASASDDPLRHLRVGHAVGRLGRTIRQVDGDVGRDVRALLAAVATRFGVGKRRGVAAPSDLLRRTDALMAQIADSGIRDRSRLLDQLIDLRAALSPRGIPTEARGS